MEKNITKMNIEILIRTVYDNSFYKSFLFILVYYVFMDWSKYRLTPINDVTEDWMGLYLK